MSGEIADLLKEGMEKTGEISFELNDGKILDADVKDVTVFYKLLGESRFKFFRSNDFKLVFVHLTEDWMRQAKIDLKDLNCSDIPIEVTIAWGEKEDTMSVRCPGGINFSTTAMHIDN
ncbi:hypothetical protein SAMN05660649_02325 [Desulfotomaculum arcticum]|uniref:Uncharacterized protein n=1 Tax=Desulfotruncus arcticus DSM 17038 TaxID=1121424 RepID=A0A1I2TTH0_9FIRM|nr:hypothetical protein [Desulfotruncus arcticus]SFG65776.1 hypothetical protein SAMN05660649_02325 [Desulfotomaculum arcticum] [Desulfotruncus arcticus DSM 17038]